MKKEKGRRGRRGLFVLKREGREGQGRGRPFVFGRLVENESTRPCSSTLLFGNGRRWRGLRVAHMSKRGGGCVERRRKEEEKEGRWLPSNFDSVYPRRFERKRDCAHNDSLSLMLDR